ncbi:MAG: hypothetical protein AAB367_00235 [Patescibacteria group bacterium]
MKSNNHHRYIYHNVTAFLASVVLTWAFWQAHIFQYVITHIDGYGYISVFAVGMAFVSSFTVIPASAALILLGSELDSIFLTALCAGFGASLGDYFIFRFVRDGLAEDLKHLFGGIKRFHILHVFRSRYFSMITPVIGAIIVASPLPDELGVGLLGLSRMSNKTFLIISFVLNTIGIWALLALVHVGV